MPDGGLRPDRPAPSAGRIGPNALLQLVPVLDDFAGPEARQRLFEAAGVHSLPAGDAMIDESHIAAVFRMLRQRHPSDFAALTARAGQRTGDYILRHRIPAAARVMLRTLPGPLAARLLVRAISAHAWTFCGTGRFRVVSRRPLILEVADNPFARGEVARAPLCFWHAAVFARLFGTLCGMASVRETTCCATGAPACRFEIGRR